MPLSDRTKLIKFPTRGRNTLDLVLTNLYDFYDQPERYAPFGLSDHVSIVLKPKQQSELSKARKVVTKKRDLRPSVRLAFRKYLDLLDIPSLFDQESSCVQKTSLLETIVTTGLDYITPLRSTVVRLTEPPWMTSRLFMLIKKRQQALNQGNIPQFKVLRNKVNRERKVCRAKYCENSVQHLKNCKPSSWWREVKKLSEMQSANRNTDEILNALRPNCDHHS